MSEEHVKGGIEKLGGRIKEAAGALTGNDKLKNEGRVDQVKGGAHQVLGDLKDAVHDVADRLNPNRHTVVVEDDPLDPTIRRP
jgi:uncharacterized protein YjbJ (UPF0337 family)